MPPASACCLQRLLEKLKSRRKFSAADSSGECLMVCWRGICAEVSELSDLIGRDEAGCSRTLFVCAQLESLKALLCHVLSSSSQTRSRLCFKGSGAAGGTPSKHQQQADQLSNADFCYAAEAPRAMSGKSSSCKALRLTASAQHCPCGCCLVNGIAKKKHLPCTSRSLY